MHGAYRDFFRKVTGEDALPYQERYGSDPFLSTLLVIPTGLGKTDAVILPWLYAQACGDPRAPTRLIIVLPRRNLTNQTADNARKRVASAGLAERVRVLELLGGSKENRDSLGPVSPAIIVCVQDLYFSRALNRGYARRPPRWPIDFALYNQDCLIVLDEIQLMDDALATSRQLAGFREMFGTYGRAPSVWMSATVNEDWLRTVNCPELPKTIRLEDKDLVHPLVLRRIHARKELGPAPVECREPKGCAKFTLSQHRKGTRSLVVCNTVHRAREIHSAISAEFPSAVLIHSRFRPFDRDAAAEALKEIPEQGQIVVSTQVLEAGVDITARLLITDVAPWGSLVQRFGRVNRYGDDVESVIRWVDGPLYAKQKDPTAPYSSDEIKRATDRLQGLTSGSPADLPGDDGPEPWQFVLRKADLIDLFDTTPDLGGNELDVSRFIRATEDKDAYVAWRDWDSDSAPPPSLREISDDELCPVSLGDVRDQLKGGRELYSWSFATEEWARVQKDRLYAGMVLVARADAGGYTSSAGWSPESKVRVDPIAGSDHEMESDSSDFPSFPKYRQLLYCHTTRVVQELELLLGVITLDPLHAAALRAAASKHDWGKSHKVFQEALHRSDKYDDFLAKQCRKDADRYRRKHFRHELGSALAMLMVGESDLSAYLVAAHHGRIRIGIRSRPGETPNGAVQVAHGICEGDILPECELTDGVSVPSVRLSLGLMELGADGGSWTDRMLRLRDSVGVFRLAYLEMILRAADGQASENPWPEATACLP